MLLPLPATASSGQSVSWPEESREADSHLATSLGVSEKKKKKKENQRWSIFNKLQPENRLSRPAMECGLSECSSYYGRVVVGINLCLIYFTVH